MDEFNPYEPPTTRQRFRSRIPNPANRLESSPTSPGCSFSASTWPFHSTSAIPSPSTTDDSDSFSERFCCSRLGFYICAFNRRFSPALIVGGALIAVTQIFPVIQIIAGMLGMTVGKAMGLAIFGDNHEVPQITTEEGGLIVTLVTGGILMATAACSGLLLRLVTPAHWWPSSTKPARS